jgi:hypothetical protein
VLASGDTATATTLFDALSDSLVSLRDWIAMVACVRR